MEKMLSTLSILEKSTLTDFPHLIIEKSKHIF